MDGSDELAFVFAWVACRVPSGGAEVGIIRGEGGYLITGPDLLRSGQRPDNWQLDRDPYYLETSMPGVFAAGDVRHGVTRLWLVAFCRDANRNQPLIRAIVLTNLATLQYPHPLIRLQP